MQGLDFSGFFRAARGGKIEPFMLSQTADLLRTFKHFRATICPGIRRIFARFLTHLYGPRHTRFRGPRDACARQCRQQMKSRTLLRMARGAWRTPWGRFYTLAIQASTAEISPMQTVETLVHARWIVPVEPAGRVLEGHALAIAHGRIVALCPSAEARNRFTATEEIHLSRHVLIPGLINAHTHAAMTLLRGVADDLPLEPWLKDHIWPLEGRWVNADFVRDGSELAIAEMLRGGITCFADMYFFPESTAQAVRQAGMRASLGMVVFDWPSPWGSGPQDYLAKGLALRDQHKNDPLLSFVFAPHSTYTVSEPWLKKLQTYAAELDLPVHTHLHE